MAAYINGIPVQRREDIILKPTRDLPVTPICTNDLDIKQLYAYFATVKGRSRKNCE